jgi:hypothetical protein
VPVLRTTVLIASSQVQRHKAKHPTLNAEHPMSKSENEI